MLHKEKSFLLECADLVEVENIFLGEVFVLTVPKCQSREIF